MDNKELKDYFYFTGDVEEKTIKPCIEWIIEHNKAHVCSRPPFLTLYVNTWGGSMPQAWGLTDMMAASNIPIRTVGTGVISSCGFIIFIAGEKGTRTLMKNTHVLTHQYSWGVGGKHHELEGRVKEFKNVYDRMVAYYLKHTKLKTRKDVESKLLPATDVWLTSSQCKTYGVCDIVADTLDIFE